MIFSYLLNMQSHPSWVCGLKLQERLFTMQDKQSHPSWVCGLKPLRIHQFYCIVSHTLRGCVD